MNIAIVLVPFSHDIGRWGSAQGPQAFLDHGLRERLQADGHTVIAPVEIALPNHERTRDTVTNLGRIGGRVADAVAGALARPDTAVLVLEGNCTHAPGVAGGVMRARGDCGVAWFDAHGDMNTSGNTLTGLWGGMPYGVMMGFDLEDWRLASGLGRPVRPEAAALFGASDLDPGELESLAAHPIARLDASEMRADDIEARVADALSARAGLAPAWYLHIDVDVAGPIEAPGCHTPAPSWPPRDVLLRAVTEAARLLPVAAFSLSAMTPSGDPQGKTARLGVELAAAVAAGLG